MKEESNDRLNYSFSLKLNVGNYESCHISASYTSDKKEDESLEDTFQRIKSFVENKVLDEAERIKLK